MRNEEKRWVIGAGIALLFFATAASAQDKPNILVMFGDDIGWSNISAYNDGMMGYRTPNIDSIADEGMRFTDAYAENSCTAGRAAFITGQSPFRTGLLKVGLPGAPEGMREEDPTLATLLKSAGYMTGQFGKNHLGDRDEQLPTNHGFDEFFGNLYHLNAEEEPEHPDYPKDPEFRKKFGPRGVIHSYADGRIEDTGPLTKKRMETVDGEFLDAALGFMDTAHANNEPFFVWFNSTRMHIWTHLKPESEGVTGQGVYADGMVEHDGHIGQLLDKLDEMGIKDNTIVIYTTDNGAEAMSWPDGGTLPFKGEKNTTWEGGFRVPMMVRWPGKIAPDQVSNEIISLQDWMPTLLAAAGQTNIKQELLDGKTIGGRRYKVHLDGYNFLPYLTGQDEKGAREAFFYFTDDGSISAFRYNDWKMSFTVQRAHGIHVWSEPFTALRVPLIQNLRMDPFERAADESILYEKWGADHMFVLVPAQEIVREFLTTFVEYPPRQKPGSFSLDRVLETLQKGAAQVARRPSSRCPRLTCEPGTLSNRTPAPSGSAVCSDRPKRLLEDAGENIAKTKPTPPRDSLPRRFFHSPTGAHCLSDARPALRHADGADATDSRRDAASVVFYIESRRFLIRDSPRPATTYEQKTGGADGVKGA